MAAAGDLGAIKVLSQDDTWVAADYENSHGIFNSRRLEHGVPSPDIGGGDKMQGTPSTNRARL